MWRLTAVFSTDTISLSSSQTWISLVSTYVICERLSVMHELAGVVENLVQNSESAPLSEQTPPPWKLKFSHFLALWVFSVLAPYPPPEKLKFSHFLALWVFSALAPYLSPAKNWNLPISWHFEYFQLWHPTPPKKLKFSHFLALLSIFSFGTLPYPLLPPPPWKLKFRQILALEDFSVLTCWQYPLPPWKLKFSHFLALWVFSALAPYPPKKI